MADSKNVHKYVVTLHFVDNPVEQEFDGVTNYTGSDAGLTIWLGENAFYHFPAHNVVYWKIEGVKR